MIGPTGWFMRQEALDALGFVAVCVGHRFDFVAHVHQEIGKTRVRLIIHFIKLWIFTCIMR